MTAAPARVRHWIIDALAGGAAALTMISIAYASVPEPKPARLAPAVAPRFEPVPEPEPLVSFSEPVVGYPVVSPWGLRRLPWERHGRLHAGVDIAAPAGVPVTAVADGVVVGEGLSAGYGRFVEVRHLDGLTSFYGHLGGVRKGVRKGLAVRAGQPIARIGNTGTSTGPHLHFEIRHDGEPVNPLYFMNRTFAEADDLPFDQAAAVPKRVRVAYVSTIPQSKRDEMAALTGEGRKSAGKARRRRAETLDAPSSSEVAADSVQAPAVGADGRMYASLDLGD